MGQMFDRYLLPMIPLFAAGIASLSPPATGARTRLWLTGAFVLLLAFFLFSVCTTRDYLAWNRTRWEAADELMKSGGVKPSEINGGFEFIGYNFFLANPLSQVSTWPAGNDYLVTFHPMPDCSVIAKHPYTHWLPPYTGNIFVLKPVHPVTSGVEGNTSDQPEK
jgi:hypothetical protein